MNFIVSDKRKDLILFFFLLLYSPMIVFSVILPHYAMSASFFVQSGINFLLLFLFCLFACLGSRGLLFTVIPLWFGAVITVNLIDLFMFVNFGAFFNYDCLQLLKHTNPEEVNGFVSLYLLTAGNILLLATYPFFGLLLLIPYKRKVIRIATVGVLFAVFTGIAFFSTVAAAEKPDSFPKRIDSFIASHIRSTMSVNLDQINSNIHASNGENNALYVLILGESHSRRHSSLYGYPRTNMPRLHKRMTEKSFFRFTDVVSPHSVTLMVMPKLFSLEAHNTGKTFNNSHTLIDIFRKAGFKTFYFTTQVENEFYLKIAKRAHQYELEKHDNALDEKLLNYFAKTIQNDPYPKKFIILHLSGNHAPYHSRYPAEFKYFPLDEKHSCFNGEQKRKCELINHYDNSVRYTDFILDRIFEMVKNSGENSFALYLPDHGEALGENGTLFGHTEFLPVLETVEIPMLLYLSPEYEHRTSSKKMQAIVKSVNKPWNSEDLPHLLIDLARINYLEFDSRRSLINPLFQERARVISSQGTTYNELKKAAAHSPITF